MHAHVILAFKCIDPTLNERDAPSKDSRGLAYCPPLTDGFSEFELLGLCQVYFVQRLGMFAEWSSTLGYSERAATIAL